MMDSQCKNELNALVTDCVKKERKAGHRAAQVLWHAGVASIAADHKLESLEVSQIRECLSWLPFIQDYYVSLGGLS